MEHSRNSALVSVLCIQHGNCSVVLSACSRSRADQMQLIPKPGSAFVRRREPVGDEGVLVYFVTSVPPMAGFTAPCFVHQRHVAYGPCPCIAQEPEARASCTIRNNQEKRKSIPVSTATGIGAHTRFTRHHQSTPAAHLIISELSGVLMHDKDSDKVTVVGCCCHGELSRHELRASACSCPPRPAPEMLMSTYQRTV